MVSFSWNIYKFSVAVKLPLRLRGRKVQGDIRNSIRTNSPGDVYSVLCGESRQIAGYLGLEVRGGAPTSNTNLGLNKRIK